MFISYLSGNNKFLFSTQELNHVEVYCKGYAVDGSNSYGASS